MEVVQPTQIVLDFLEKTKFYQAKIVLEKESKIKLRNFGREIDFIYDLITDGQFKDALECLSPLQQREDFDYNAVAFEIRRQCLLEEFETSKAPDTDAWIQDIKEI